MTISYTKEVASSTKFGVFIRLLFRWRGSVYKMIWPEILIYTLIYVVCSLIYRFALTDNHQKYFENVTLYFRTFGKGIPVTFVLGFYVSLVVQRWWGQFETIPWPDTLAIYVSNSIQGKDVRTRMMRRTIVRYANLAFALTVRALSPSIMQKRYPTLDSLVQEGLLLDTEKPILEDAIQDSNGNVFWVPLVWAVSLVETARSEMYIKHDLAVKTVVGEIIQFRSSCGKLLSYEWISIPLVYTQVVTIAVYTYLVATILGGQFISKGDVKMDLYVPILTYLQLIFYLGWLKVAESLVNPFGKDDEDFDVDSLLNRHIKISYLIADKMLDAHPELHQDKHWDEVFHKQSLLRTPSEQDEDAVDEKKEIIAEDALAFITYTEDFGNQV